MMHTQNEDELTGPPEICQRKLRTIKLPLPLPNRNNEDMENALPEMNFRHLRKITGLKGVLKRCQESVELMEWKCSDLSLEEELKTTFAVSDLGNDESCSDSDQSTLLWTEEDKQFVAKKCENKLPFETFWSKSFRMEKEIDRRKSVVKNSPVILNSLLELNGDKLRPVFDNIRIDSTRVRGNALLGTKVKATIIPNKTILTEV